MAIHISNFTPAHFQLVFPILPEETKISANKELRLNLTDTLIPSVTLGEIELPWMGGQSFTEGGGIEFGDWNVDFIVDSNLTNWKLLANWVFSINNNVDVHGRSDQSFSCDASLYVLDNFENEVLKIMFKNVWPKTLGELSLSYQETGTVLKCSVSFAYDGFYYEE